MYINKQSDTIFLKNKVVDEIMTNEDRFLASCRKS